MKCRAPLAIGAALFVLPFTPAFQAYAEGEAPAAPPARASCSKLRDGRAPAQAAPSPAKQEEPAPHQATAPPAKPDPAPAQPAANPANPDPPAIKLSCRAVRNDIGMYEPLRFMSVTIDLPKKYVKVVHEGDGKAFEFTDGGGGRKNPAAFVKITEESVVYGQQGRESWRIDRYTGTMTSSSFTIQFECQPPPAERKF